MIKKICLLLLIFVFSCSVIYASDVEKANFYKTNEETGYTVVINDEASLLSENEIVFLSDDMYALTEYGNIVFYSTTTPGSSQHQIAHDYYYDIFGTDSGSVLLIDMNARIVYIYSDGNNLSTITSSKSEIITDNIYKYLTKGEYYSGVSNAFSQMYTLLNGGKIPENMRYFSNIFIALILGLFVTFIYAFSVSKIASASPYILLKNTKKKFIINNVTARKIGERKAYSPLVKNTTYVGFGGHSSGRGGSYGHSAGGHSAGHSAGHSSHSAGHSSHSSGGGGGHRF